MGFEIIVKHSSVQDMGCYPLYLQHLVTSRPIRMGSLIWCDQQKQVKLARHSTRLAYDNKGKTSMEILLALYALGGLLLAGLSVPLILHKIPPNGLYGFRIPSTLDDPELWYTVNAYAGKRFLVAGLGTSVGAISLYFTSPPNVDVYALSCLGLFLAFFLWAMITSFLYLKSLQS